MRIGRCVPICVLPQTSISRQNQMMAERVGFEPTEGLTLRRFFKTGALNRSAISPMLLRLTPEGIGCQAGDPRCAGDA